MVQAPGWVPAAAQAVLAWAPVALAEALVEVQVSGPAKAPAQAAEPGQGQVVPALVPVQAQAQGVRTGASGWRPRTTRLSRRHRPSPAAPR